MEAPTPLTLAEQIGRQVRAALAEQARTQSDLADVLGITQSSVSRRLLGAYCFAGDELILIAQWLGVAPGRFLAPVPIPQQRSSSPATSSASGAAA